MIIYGYAIVSYRDALFGKQVDVYVCIVRTLRYRKYKTALCTKNS